MAYQEEVGEEEFNELAINRNQSDLIRVAGNFIFCGFADDLGNSLQQGLRVLHLH